MPLGTFTLVIDADRLDGSDETAATVTVTLQDTSYLIDGNQFRTLTELAKGLPVSLPYSADLPTDVAPGGGLSTTIGYVVTVRTAYGSTTSTTLAARADGDTAHLAAITASEIVDVSGNLNDTVVSGLVSASGTVTRSNLDAEFINTAEREAADGVAGLDASGKILATRIPDLSATYSPRARVEELSVNVKAFGAVGDWNGTTGTDNLTAFNNAVAALPSGGGRIYIPDGDYRLSNGWQITKDNITVVANDGATVRTVAATVGLGATVAFMGGGGIQTPSNAVDTPQSTRADWIGGRISASGSGNLDNALGYVRYKNAHAADVRLDADRKALTAQYNVDNVVWERFVVERGDVAAITIETSCNDVTVRDFDVLATLGHGLHIMSVDGTSRRNDRIRVHDGLIRSAGGWGVLAGATDVLDVRRVRVDAATSGRYNFTDCTFVTTDQPASAAATAKASGLGWENGESVALSLQNGWVTQSASYPTPAAARDPFGKVTLTGNVKSGTTTAGTVLTNLPVGYRPAKNKSFPVDSIDPTGAIVPARVLVEANGNVTLARGGNNHALSLDNVSFHALLTA